MNRVPSEILYEIFCHLQSPQDLVWCSEVCRGWFVVVHQPRLWYRVDLSKLSSSQLARLSLKEGGGEISLMSKVQQARQVDVSCPIDMTGGDLEYVYRLIRDNTALEHLAVERLQITEENKWAQRLFSQVSPELQSVSLRQTLCKPGNAQRLLRRVPGLKSLDLSYTLVEYSTLETIAKCCPQLERLMLDSVYTLTTHDFDKFFTLPMSISHLSLKYLSAVDPSSLIGFAQRTPVVNLELEGCDLFTFKDIAILDKVTHGQCRISHTAILTEDSIDGYMDLVKRLSGLVINKRSF